MKTIEEILKSSSAVRITTEGKVTEISPKNGKVFSLEEMYEHCNCNIVEFVYLPNHKIMVCDEEGLLKSDWKKNDIASDVYHSVGGHPMHPIAGNVMIIFDSQSE